MGTNLPTEIKAPARAIWCVWGIGVLFLLPAATFLFSWYRPYLPDVFLQPAMDIVLTLLGVVALPILVWLRASKVRRRRWLWTGLTLVGTLLGLLLHPLGGLVCSGLPVLAYAVTGLTNRARQTSKRDTITSWALVVLGAPLGFLVWWLAFYGSYISDLSLGPPPFVSVQPTYEISLSADLSRLSPDAKPLALYSSLKVMLLRLKEYSPGVVSTTVGDDTISIRLFRIRNLEETVALVSNPGLFELVDIGESPLSVGATLPLPHRTVVSGRYLRTTRDWRHGQWPLSDARIGFDQSGYPVLELEFDSDGAKMLRDFTSASIGKYVALTMDNVIIVSPVIKSPILEGQLVVDGISLEQARLIILKLKYGVLPMPFAVVSTNPVTPVHR